MFQPDPDYNIWLSLLKIGGCVLAFYIWGMITRGWGKNK